RNEDVRLQPALRGVRRHRVREVAGGRARDGVEAELARLRDRDRHHAVLERPRRVTDRVVLHPDLAATELVGEVLRADARREAYVVADGDVAGERQELLVPPHARRAGLDRLPRDDALQRIVPIVDLERAKTELADMEGRRFVVAAALATT